MVSFATTEDGRDSRRKYLYFLVFGSKQGNSKPTPTSEFYPEATLYVRIRFCRNGSGVQIGAMFMKPDGFWKLAHLIETEKCNYRKFGKRCVWSYRPILAWTTEAPETPSLELLKLWVRMNFDWFLFNKVYKPQLHRMGLMI